MSCVLINTNKVPHIFFNPKICWIARRKKIPPKNRRKKTNLNARIRTIPAQKCFVFFSSFLLNFLFLITLMVHYMLFNTFLCTFKIWILCFYLLRKIKMKTLKKTPVFSSPTICPHICDQITKFHKSFQYDLDQDIWIINYATLTFLT